MFFGGLLVGILIGSFIGVFAVALCNISNKEDNYGNK